MAKSHDEDLQLMRISYLKEVLAYCEDLEAIIMKYQDEGGDLNALLRVVHSIKGAAGAFQLESIVVLSHRYESLVISDPGTDREGLVTKMLRFNDLLIEVTKGYLDNVPINNLELQARISKALGLLSDGSKGPYRVLLVEPSELIRKLILKGLENLGLEVTVEKSGLDALEHLLSHPFDCLITAGQPGSIDGLSLIDAIYAIRNIKQKPMTVYVSSNEPSAQEVNVKPDHFLKKDDHLKENVMTLLKPFASNGEKTPVPPLKKVLMVDDSEEFHALFKLAYKEEDVETSCLQDPTKVEEVVRELDPDLILLDVMMPERSGPDVYKALKDKGHLKQRSVFFLTALASAEDRNQLVKLGAQGVIKKPFNHHELPEEIHRLWTKVHQG